MRLPRPRMEEATAGGLLVDACVRTVRLKTPTVETTVMSADCPCKTYGRTRQKKWGGVEFVERSSVAVLYVLKPSPECHHSLVDSR
jgi:hypothetical protein